MLRQNLVNSQQAMSFDQLAVIAKQALESLSTTQQQDRPNRSTTNETGGGEDDDDEDRTFCRACNVHFEDMEKYNRHIRGIGHMQRQIEFDRQRAPQTAHTQDVAAQGRSADGAGTQSQYKSFQQNRQEGQSLKMQQHGNQQQHRPEWRSDQRRSDEGQWQHQPKEQHGYQKQWHHHDYPQNAAQPADQGEGEEWHEEGSETWWEEEEEVDEEGKEENNPDDMFVCELCDVSNNSEQSLMMHLRGRFHNTVQRALQTGVAVPHRIATRLGPKTQLPAKQRPTTVFKAQSSEAGSSLLVNMLPCISKPVVGVRCVREYEVHGKVMFNCETCDSACDSTSIRAHLIAMKHRMKYLRSHHPGVYELVRSHGGSKRELTAFLEEICTDIEKKEGRGTPILAPPSVDIQGTVSTAQPAENKVSEESDVQPKGMDLAFDKNMSKRHLSHTVARAIYQEDKRRQEVMEQGFGPLGPGIEPRRPDYLGPGAVAGIGGSQDPYHPDAMGAGFLPPRAWTPYMSEEERHRLLFELERHFFYYLPLSLHSEEARCRMFPEYEKLGLSFETACERVAVQEERRARVLEFTHRGFPLQEAREKVMAVENRKQLIREYELQGLPPREARWRVIVEEERSRLFEECEGSGFTPLEARVHIMTGQARPTLVQRYESQGMPPDEALRRAFGEEERLKILEDSLRRGLEEQGGSSGGDNLLDDVRDKWLLENHLDQGLSVEDAENKVIAHLRQQGVPTQQAILRVQKAKSQVSPRLLSQAQHRKLETLSHSEDKPRILETPSTSSLSHSQDKPRIFETPSTSLSHSKDKPRILETPSISSLSHREDKPRILETPFTSSKPVTDHRNLSSQLSHEHLLQEFEAGGLRRDQALRILIKELSRPGLPEQAASQQSDDAESITRQKEQASKGKPKGVGHDVGQTHEDSNLLGLLARVRDDSLRQERKRGSGRKVSRSPSRSSRSSYISISSSGSRSPSLPHKRRRLSLSSVSSASSRSRSRSRSFKTVKRRSPSADSHSRSSKRRLYGSQRDGRDSTTSRTRTSDLQSSRVELQAERRSTSSATETASMEELRQKAITELLNSGMPALQVIQLFSQVPGTEHSTSQEGSHGGRKRGEENSRYTERNYRGRNRDEEDLSYTEKNYRGRNRDEESSLYEEKKYRSRNRDEEDLRGQQRNRERDKDYLFRGKNRHMDDSFRNYRGRNTEEDSLYEEHSRRGRKRDEHNLLNTEQRDRRRNSSDSDEAESWQLKKENLKITVVRDRTENSLYNERNYKDILIRKREKQMRDESDTSSSDSSDNDHRSSTTDRKRESRDTSDKEPYKYNKDRDMFRSEGVARRSRADQPAASAGVPKLIVFDLKGDNVLFKQKVAQSNVLDLSGEDESEEEAGAGGSGGRRYRAVGRIQNLGDSQKETDDLGQDQEDISSMDSGDGGEIVATDPGSGTIDYRYKKERSRSRERTVNMERGGFEDMRNRRDWGRRDYTYGDWGDHSSGWDRRDHGFNWNRYSRDHRSWRGRSNNRDRRDYSRRDSRDRRNRSRSRDRRDRSRSRDRRDYGRSWDRRDYGRSWDRRDFDRSWDRRDYGRSWDRRDFRSRDRRDSSMDRKESWDYRDKNRDMDSQHAAVRGESSNVQTGGPTGTTAQGAPTLGQITSGLLFPIPIPNQPADLVSSLELTAPVDASTQVLRASQPLFPIAAPTQILDTEGGAEHTASVGAPENMALLDAPEAPAPMNVSKPTAIVDVSEPSNHMDVSEPQAQMGISEPKDAVVVSEPEAPLAVSEPTASMDIPEPTAQVDVTEPSPPVDVSEPIASLDVSEPTALVDVSKPSPPVHTFQNTSSEDVSETPVPVDVFKPTALVDVCKPSAPVDPFESTALMDVSEPTPSLDFSEPATAVSNTTGPVDVFEPATAVFEPLAPVDVSEPTAVMAVSERTSPVDVNEPKTPVDVSEPTTPVAVFESTAPTYAHGPTAPESGFEFQVSTGALEPTAQIDEAQTPVDSCEPTGLVDAPNLQATDAAEPVVLVDVLGIPPHLDDTQPTAPVGGPQLQAMGAQAAPPVDGSGMSTDHRALVGAPIKGAAEVQQELPEVTATAVLPAVDVLSQQVVCCSTEETAVSDSSELVQPGPSLQTEDSGVAMQELHQTGLAEKKVGKGRGKVGKGQGKVAKVQAKVGQGQGKTRGQGKMSQQRVQPKRTAAAAATQQERQLKHDAKEPKND